MDCTKFISSWLLVFLLALFSQAQTQLNFEDFEDQDVFNNFSGNSGEWSYNGGVVFSDFNNSEAMDPDGVCKGVKYSFTDNQGEIVGLWFSSIGRNEDKFIWLNFDDLYDDLKNSSGNPTDIENVKVTSIKFWAKGKGTGPANQKHRVFLQVKDTSGDTDEEYFDIPDHGVWQQYTFNTTALQNVNKTKVKELVLGIRASDNQNSGEFYIDQITIETDEVPYDASNFTDNMFLDLVAHRAFFYFLKFTDELDFAFDRSTFSDLISVAAIGYQLSAYAIKPEWMEGAEGKVERILRNLVNLPQGPQSEGTAGYKGFFYHFLESNTGLRKDQNVELSLYDTMLLLYGVIMAKERFTNNGSIQSNAQQLIDQVQWNWMVDPTNKQFHLGWKPENSIFLGNVDGYTDEATLVDILGLGSTTFPTTMETYNARPRDPAINIGTYPAGSSDSIVAAWTGSLFNYFFVDGWINLKNQGLDNHSAYPIDIWENNYRAILANYEFCQDHKDTERWDGDNHYTSYQIGWGLSAVDNLVPASTNLLSEYFAIGALPTHQNIIVQTPAPHFGTVPVYGAGSSINFLPGKAIQALRNYYELTDLWIPLFGFGDAFSTDPHYYEVDTTTYGPILDSDYLIIHPATWIKNRWENHVMLAVDQGPMLLSIINYLYGTAWELSENSPTIQKGLEAIYSKTNSCPNTYPNYEGFESGLGEWIQSSNDDFEWARRSGGTPSSATGPTSAAEGNYYLYMEASSPNFPTKAAILESPCFSLAGLSSPTFEFQYHMYGSSMGTLSVEISTNNGVSWQQLWSENGDQGNSWHQQSIDLSAYTGSSEVKLRFYGQTGISFVSDIAIDDVRVFNATANPPVADFNADLTIVQEGGSVQYADQSTNSATSWTWTFEGGTPTNSNSQNPQVTYNTAGTYDVTLSVSNIDGSHTITKTDYIVVSAIGSCVIDPVIITQEAELGSPGAGVVRNRSQASNDRTLWINNQGDVACWTINISSPGEYWLDVQYSNDGPGTSDDVSVLMNGNKIGEFQTVNTRCTTCPPGSGWNVFTNSSLISLGMLNAGIIDLCLRLDSHDGYGVEFDKLTLNLPSSGITNFPYHEGFEVDFGGWTQATGDDFDWRRQTGGTPSSGTGPTSAAEGGYYIYLESSSPNFPNKVAILESPCIDLSGLNSPSFEFQYHMYGSSMGVLSLELSFDGGASWQQVWSESGDQGNTWHQQSIDLSVYSGTSGIQLRFSGHTGSSYRSDIAIDDLLLRNLSPAPEIPITGKESEVPSKLPVELRAYPNPAHQVINIEICSLNEELDGKINLIDFQGMNIRSLDMNQDLFYCQSFQMGIEDLPSGTYYVQFINKETSIIHRISVIRN